MHKLSLFLTVTKEAFEFTSKRHEVEIERAHLSLDRWGR